MADIKSALELALEKAEQYGRASKEEMAAQQHQEQGRGLAVHFLKEGGNLEEELRKLPAEAQGPARDAIKEVFLRNITLPRNGEADERQSRALEGLLQVARNKKAMAQMQAQLQQILQQFLQVRQNAYQQLKARFGATVGNMQRALEAQYRTRMKVEAEQIPQFQEEWRRFQSQLLDQFEPMLEDCKARMKEL